MRLVLLIFAATVAVGQASRVFQLRQNQTRQELEQIATVLRATADLPQVSIDHTTRTVTVAGTPAQIALADWLVQQLDVPADKKRFGVPEYRPPASENDVVRVFYITHAPTLGDLNEIATTVRSLAEIRRMFIYTPLNAVAMRGTNQQMLLAAWLTEQLDQPGDESAAPHEYRLPGDDVARVFQLTYPQTPQQLQEISILIRSLGDISRVFVYRGRRTLALRGTAEQGMLAAWLVSELDKPITWAVAAQDSAALREYRLSSVSDNVVRVFYFPKSQSTQRLQQIATDVRIATRIPRMFIYTPLGALAVRATAGEMDTAEQVIEQMKAQ